MRSERLKRGGSSTTSLGRYRSAVRYLPLNSAVFLWQAARSVLGNGSHQSRNRPALTQLARREPGAWGMSPGFQSRSGLFGIACVGLTLSAVIVAKMKFSDGTGMPWRRRSIAS